MPTPNWARLLRARPSSLWRGCFLTKDNEIAKRRAVDYRRLFAPVVVIVHRLELFEDIGLGHVGRQFVRI